MLVGDRTELTSTILTVESLRRTCDFCCCYKQAWLLDPVTGGYEGIQKVFSKDRHGKVSIE